MKREIRIVIDGPQIARHMIAAFQPRAAAFLAAADAIGDLNLSLRALRRAETRRRRRARYEIREAILARRLGITPEPWRGECRRERTPDEATPPHAPDPNPSADQRRGN